MGVAGFAALLLSLTGISSTSSTIQIEKADGRRCQGAFVAPRVVATAAHCLDNFSDGGVRWNGQRAEQAFVADSVSRRGRASNDDDFALLVFSTSHAYASPDFSRQSPGAPVSVVTYRGGSPRTYPETVSSYTSNSTQTADVFIATTNQSGLRAGDSGAPLYSRAGKFLGVLRGCVTGMCGFFSVHSGNPVTREVFRKLENRYPGFLNSGAAPVSPRHPVGLPPRPQRFTCNAQCRIEYQRPYNVATESVRAILIRASSAYEAQTVARGELERNCNEYCVYSRDAFRCTLSSAIQCH